MVPNQKPQIRIWHGPLILLIAITSYMIHEFAHWATGEIMGYDLYVGINKAGLARGEYAQEWHAQLVSISGPVATILIAMIALILIYRHELTQLFPVVFFSMMMRSTATLISFINPNDEARVSEWLGIGKWTLPLGVSLFLGWLTFLAAERLGLNWKAWIICFVFSAIAITIVVFAEPHMPLINPYGDTPQIIE